MQCNIIRKCYMKHPFRHVQIPSNTIVGGIFASPYPLLRGHCSLVNNLNIKHKRKHRIVSPIVRPTIAGKP